MKKLMILIATMLTITSALAQRWNRPVIVRPTPVYPASCSYNLESRGFFANEWNFVENFTRPSCPSALDACEYAKYIRPNSHNFRCTYTNVIPSPVPTPVPDVRSCEYRIQTRRGFEPDRFTARGFNACEQAESQCLRILRIKRERGEVGRDAQCVSTSSPRPTPPRMVTAQCTVEQYFSSNSGGRPTGNRFNGTGRGRNYSSARAAACSQALQSCSNVSSGRFYCVELN